MIRTLFTHNPFHLGDSFVWLNALRRIARENHGRKFVHFGNANQLGELSPVVEDIPNIELFSYDSVQWHDHKPNALNSWKNHREHWVKSKLRWDWSAFTLEHHNFMAKKLNVHTRFNHRDELLFDYPALNPNSVTPGMWFYDFLVVNSRPNSGQLACMADHENSDLDNLATELSKRYKVIVTNPVHGLECTRDSAKSLTDIGRLSMLCQHHVMVSTGPSWPTMNTTNHHHAAGRTRMVLLSNGERLNMPNIEQVHNVEEARALLRERGLF